MSAPRLLPLALAAVLAFIAAALPVRADERSGGAPPPAPVAADTPPPAPRGPERVALRFGWRPPLELDVTFRRTLLRSGAPAEARLARYRTRVRPAPGGALRVALADTRWEGAPPFPPALAADAIAASERVGQRIARDGEFDGLEDVEVMRPVLAALYARPDASPEEAARAVEGGLAALAADAEAQWNRAVGFWIGAELELGQPYEMRTEAPLPLLPGARTDARVEFQVRRRVPCHAAEREARCVEVTLRSTPEPRALERHVDALAARLSTAEAPVAAAALAGLTLESELVLVTDPATLVPVRLVWTESLRAGGVEDGPPLEVLERSEYDHVPVAAPGPSAAR